MGYKHSVLTKLGFLRVHVFRADRISLRKMLLKPQKWPLKPQKWALSACKTWSLSLKGIFTSGNQGNALRQDFALFMENRVLYKLWAFLLPEFDSF